MVPRTITQWNSLSLSVVNSQTAEEFRALLIWLKTQPKDFCFFCFVFSSKFQNRTPWRNDHNLTVPVSKERKVSGCQNASCGQVWGISETRDQNYRSIARPRLRLADLLTEVVILQLRRGSKR